MLGAQGAELRAHGGRWSEGLVNFQVVLCDNALELEGEQYTVGKHFSNSFHPPWLFSITVKGAQTKHGEASADT